MPKSVSKSAVLSAAWLFLSCFLFNGCEGCPSQGAGGNAQQSSAAANGSSTNNQQTAENLGNSTRDAVNAFSRGLTADERTSIEDAQKKLAMVFEDENDMQEPQSLGEFQKLLDHFHDRLMRVDVSRCPKEYRDQVENIVHKVGVINNEFTGIENSDEDKDHFLRRFNNEIEDVNHQVSELNAVAHQYGVNTQIVP